MAKVLKTTSKLPSKPFTGKEGNTFSKDNQPDAILKKAGWEQWRKERHLTQSIIAEMIGKDGKPKKQFKEYIQSLIINAKIGNAKAIETINKGLEDIETIKHEITSVGKDLADEKYD